MIAKVTFIASAAFIIYVVAGYPVLLAWIARRGEKPVRSLGALKTVSVLIAVHNGGNFIRGKLESIFALNYPRELIEVFVLSDGSTDDTESIARQFDGVTVISLPRGGKCAALTRGFTLARNEILVLTDVRQRLNSDSLRHLVANFSDPEIGAVSGELIILRGETQEEADVGLYWRYESRIRRDLARIDSMFGATGPFYAIRRSLVVPIPREILLDDMYLPLSAYFRGYRLVVDEDARAYDFPTTLDTEFRRKVRTLAGNWQLFRYYPQLLGPLNRMWFHYVSYKLGRLLLPYALISIATASFFLPSPLNLLALTAQALLYCLPVLDGILPQSSFLKRISSLARTFVVMMAATICAVSVFFIPPQDLWKITTIRGRTTNDLS